MFLAFFFGAIVAIVLFAISYRAAPPLRSNAGHSLYKTPVDLSEFWEMGKVDLTKIITPTLNDPNVEDFVLVNDKPSIISLWEHVSSIDITTDALYPTLKKRFPNLSLWPIHGFHSMQRLPRGGQRFIFNFGTFHERAKVVDSLPGYTSGIDGWRRTRSV